MKLAKPFRGRVLSVVRKIPRGKVLSYKEVARRAGNSYAARAVGAILRANYRAYIPCHRVIYSDGRIGGYNRGVARKRTLLRKENAL
ncbi:MAG: MGMT family protein [Minisyncoccia bacterium]|jgi:O-6-methylguanine DNA methyltransferase